MRNKIGDTGKPSGMPVSTHFSKLAYPSITCLDFLLIRNDYIQSIKFLSIFTSLIYQASLTLEI